MGDGRVADHRQQLAQRRLDPVVVGGALLDRRVDARSEPIAGATATERDPVVDRALPVDDHAPIVAERLAVAQTDLVPHGRRERFGGDHQRVERHERSPFARQVAGVGLGRPHDDVGGDGATVGAHRRPRRPMTVVSPGARHDRRSRRCVPRSRRRVVPRRGPARARDASGGCERRADTRARPDRGGVQPLARRGGIEQRQLSAEAGRLELRHLVALVRGLHRGAGRRGSRRPWRTRSRSLRRRRHGRPRRRCR